MEKGNQNPRHRREGRIKDYTLQALKIVATVLVLALLVLVSWNMFAPDMFGLEAIRMKQALGLVLFAGVFTALLRIGHRPRAHTASHGQ